MIHARTGGLVERQDAHEEHYLGHQEHPYGDADHRRHLEGKLPEHQDFREADDVERDDRVDDGRDEFTEIVSDSGTVGTHRLSLAYS